MNNEKIVLTGSNSGIGLEVLKLLAKNENNTILAVDLHTNVISTFGENVIPFVCDVSSPEGVDNIFEKALDEMGDITLFYANAGYPYYEKMDYIDWDRTLRMFETNVFSPIYTYQKFIRYLNGRPGRLAITISAIGKMALPGYTTYSASKFALEGFRQGIRFEMPRNLKMTCLYPIATNTNFFKAANKHEFKKPFPVQDPAVVARKMVKGIEKNKKSVNPSRLYSLSTVLFGVLPFIKNIYLSIQKKKFEEFCDKESRLSKV